MIYYGVVVSLDGTTIKFTVAALGPQRVFIGEVSGNNYAAGDRIVVGRVGSVRSENFVVIGNLTRGLVDSTGAVEYKAYVDAEIARVQGEIDEFGILLAGVANEFETHEFNNNTKFGEIDAILNDLQLDLGSLGTNYGNLVSQLEALDTELAALDADLQLNDAALLENQTKLEEARTALGLLQTDLEANEAAVTQAAQKAQDALDDVAALVPQLEQNQTDLLEAQNAINAAEAGIVTLNEELGVLDSAVELAKTDIISARQLAQDAWDDAAAATGFASSATIEAGNAHNLAVTAWDKALAAANAGGGIVLNGSFEQVDANGNPVEWPAPHSTRTYPTTKAHSGIRHLMMVSAVGSIGAYQTKRHPTSPGRSYYFELRAMIESGSVNQTVGLIIQARDNAGAVVQNIYVITSSTNLNTMTWTPISGTVKVTAPTAVDINVGAYIQGGVGASYAFDSIVGFDVTEAVAAQEAATAAADKATTALSTANAAVTGTVVEYAVGNSETVAPTTGWSAATPARTAGTFIWTRTVVTYGTGSPTTTNPALLTGNTGAPGTPATPLYTWLKYADSPSAGMSDLPTGKTYMGIALNKTTPTESTNYADYQWSLIKGADGIGTKGEDGVSLYTWVKYATDAAGAGMSDDPAGKSYIGFAYNKASATESSVPGDYQWAKIEGPQGNPGNAGKGVSSIVEEYYSSTSATTQAGGTWGTSVPAWVNGRFIWTRSKITYTDASVTTTNPVNVTGGTGSTGGDGRSVTSVDVMYYQSTSATALAGGTWQTTAPAWVNGRFVWSKTVVTYSSGTPTETVPVNITGQQGSTGSTGVSVTEIKPYFQKAAPGATVVAPANTVATPPSPPWYPEEPAYETGTVLWRTERVSLNNGTRQYTPATLVASYAAAAQAIVSANGRNSIIWRTTEPSGTTNPVTGNPLVEGDEWRRYDTDGFIVGIWTWISGAWKITAITSESISNLDVGKLTVTGVSNLQSVVADRMVANFAAFKLLTADKLIVGSATNLIPNGALEKGNLDGWGSSSFVYSNTDMPPGLSASASYTGQTVLQGGDVYFDVEPGGEYVFEVWLKASVAGSRMYIELRNQDGGHGTRSYPLPDYTPGFTGTTGSDYPVNAFTVPTVWTKYVCRTVVNAGVRKLRVGGIYFNHSSGSVFTAKQSIAGMRLRPRASGELIVENAITTDKLRANAVTAEKIFADVAFANQIVATLGTFSEVMTTKLTSNMIAADAITSTQIKAESITTAKIKAGAVDTDQIAANAITALKIAANTITANEIKGSTITANEIATETITALQIQADAITAVKIATDAVTANKIKSDEILARHIKTDEILARHIKSGEITTGHLAALSITAAKIAGRAITADKLVIASSDNMIPDPEFRDPAYWPYSPVPRREVGPGYDGSAGFVLTATGTQHGQYMGGSNAALTIPVQPGKYRFSVWVKSTIALTGNNQVAVYSRTRTDPNNFPNILGSAPFTNPNAESTATTQILYNKNPIAAETWVQLEAVLTIPSTVSLWTPGFYLQTATPVGALVTFSKPVLTRMMDGKLIVDGTVEATHIASQTIVADNLKTDAIIARHIKAYEINTIHLKTDAVDARTIKADQITANHLRSDSVTSDKIAGKLLQGLDIYSPSNVSAGPRVHIGQSVTPGMGYVIEILRPGMETHIPTLQLGGEIADQFSLMNEEGELHAGISANGNVFGKSATIDGDILMSGISLSNWLTQLPRGVRATARLQSGTPPRFNNNEIGLFEMGCDMYFDRVYKIQSSFSMWCATASRIRVNIRFTVGAAGAVPPAPMVSSGSTVLRSFYIYLPASQWVTSHIFDIYRGQYSAYNARFLWTFANETGAHETQFAVSSTGPLIGLIEDIGLASEAGVDHTTLMSDATFSTGGGTPSTGPTYTPPVASRQLWTTTWHASHYASYRVVSGTATAVTDSLHQGYYSPARRYSVVLFQGNSVSGQPGVTPQQALNGSPQIQKMEIWIESRSWYAGSGGQYVIGRTAQTSATLPSGNPTFTTGTYGVGGRWIELPSAWWPYFALASSPARGITLGEGAGTSSTFYGKSRIPTVGNTGAVKLRATYYRI